MPATHYPDLYIIILCPYSLILRTLAEYNVIVLRSIWQWAEPTSRPTLKHTHLFENVSVHQNVVKKKKNNIQFWP